MGKRMGMLAALTATVASGWTHAAEPDVVARGAYLVTASGCADCHTPLKMGPEGPMPDPSRGLSGHPEGMALPPSPAAQGPWAWGGLATNTAFWGQWGVSYSANLTPDRTTGVGSWSADTFVKAMRTGRHLGVGRPILPPMPWRPTGSLNDRDLRAMFAYVRAQPAIRNAIPEPSPPATR